MAIKRKSGKKIRLTVFRSNKYIFAQLIDDEACVTLASASSIKLPNGGNRAAAAVVGKEIAKKAMLLNLDSVYYDRNRFRYVGRVKELAEAARAEGLKI